MFSFFTERQSSDLFRVAMAISQEHERMRKNAESEIAAAFREAARHGRAFVSTRIVDGVVQIEPVQDADAYRR